MKKIWNWLEEHAFEFSITVVTVMIIWIEFFVKR